MDYSAGAATGSGLAFTFVRKDFLDGQAMYGAEPAYQDFVVKQGMWKFGLYPERGMRGFSPNMDGANASRSSPTSMRTVYLEPAGRTLTASEIERAVMRNADGLSGYLTNWPMSA